MLNKTTRLLGLVALGVLTGCGGGGGSSTPATPAEATASVMTKLQTGGALLSLDRSAIVAGSGSGSDANANGVRDDVDAWIAAQKFAATQTNSINQLARSYQRVLTLDLTAADGTALRAARLKSSDAVECLMQRAPSIEEGYKLVADLRRVSVNTSERTKAYLAYVEKVNDTVVRAPEDDGCDK